MEYDECVHRSLNYPNPLQRGGTCRECGYRQPRYEWMNRFSDSELRDLQVYGELMAVKERENFPESDSEYLTPRQAHQRKRSLEVMHNLGGRMDEIRSLFELARRVMAECAT